MPRSLMWTAGLQSLYPLTVLSRGTSPTCFPATRIVVLRCRPDELKKRLAQRKYREAKIRENADAEALDVCLIETVEEFDPSQIFELDTTGHDAVYCADRIEGFIRGEIPADFGHLDWSEFLEI